MNTTPVARLDGPGDLLASVPAMLGFTPDDSLVLIAVTEGKVGTVIRADTPPTDDHACAPELVKQLANATAAAKATSAISVVVDQTARTVLVERLTEALAALGIPHTHALRVPAFTAGAAWEDVLDPTVRGELADPRSTVLTAFLAARGAVVHRSKEDMLAVVRADDEATLRRREALIFERMRHLPTTAASLETMRSALRKALTGSVQPSDQDVADFAFALADPMIRDAALATAVPNDSMLAGAALNLWQALTRAMPGSDRAEPATLAAFAAYMQGEGTLVSRALQIALQAQPDHLLANMLMKALRSGTHPRKLEPLALHDEIGLLNGFEADAP